MTNREHFITTLQACYFGDRNAFNEILRIYKEMENVIKEVRELLKNDYFEDGSFNNYKEVFELLDKVEEK